MSLNVCLSVDESNYRLQILLLQVVQLGHCRDSKQESVFSKTGVGLMQALVVFVCACLCQNTQTGTAKRKKCRH